jgi:hypothetical protein
MILRDSSFKGTATLQQVATMAAAARGEDVGGSRSQFVELVNKAAPIRGRQINAGTSTPSEVHSERPGR